MLTTMTKCLEYVNENVISPTTTKPCLRNAFQKVLNHVKNNNKTYYANLCKCNKGKICL